MESHPQKLIFVLQRLILHHKPLADGCPIALPHFRAFMRNKPIINVIAHFDEVALAITIDKVAFIIMDGSETVIQMPFYPTLEE